MLHSTLRMHFKKSVRLCIMLCFFYFKDVYSLTVAVSKSAEKAVLGDNPFTLACTYTYSSNLEQLFSIELKRKRESDSDFVTIITFQNPSSPLNASYQDTSLEPRTVATDPTMDSRTATLVFNQIDCDDKATYRWIVVYGDGPVKTEMRDLSFVVKADTRFKDDGTVILSQNTNIEEGDKIVFTCSGDVGNEPVGHLGWFYYLNNDTSNAINASSLAQPTSPVYQSSTCSYRRTSTLELTMTSTFHNILVKCTVHQDKFDQFGNGYVQTNNIPVYYAYPAPTYSWVLPDGTVSEGPSYTLSNLQLGDNGTYTCVVYNTYKGANHTVNESTYIYVRSVITDATKASTLPRDVSSLEITVSKSAEKAVLGDNPFTLSCTYTFSSNLEQLFFIELKRKRESDSDFVTIVTFQNPSSPLNASYQDTSLESRTVATNPTDSSKTATLVFSQIDCDDKATYRWIVIYTDGQVKIEMKDLSFVVKADTRFKDDGSVILSQNTNIEEGDKIVFTCSGDVGNEPVGHLGWFYYLNNDMLSAINASSLAQPTSSVYQSSTCSYRRTSTLELTMTSTFHNILVRCTVQQDKFDQFGNGYVQTNNIPVYYSPKITSIEDKTVEEGAESLELLCNADAYPTPTYSWVLPDGTVSEGPSYTLSNLQLGDNGTYTCVVFNTYKGVNHTVNETTSIYVRSVITDETKASTLATGSVITDATKASNLPRGSVNTETTKAPAVPRDKYLDESEDKSTVIALAVVTGISIAAAGVVVVVSVYCVKRRKQLNTAIPEETHTYQDLVVYENRDSESPYLGICQEQHGQ